MQSINPYGCSGRARRGVVVVYACVLMAILLGMVAFAVDIGYIVEADTELQRTADACALAAVLQLPDQAAAQSVAKAVAEENYGLNGAELLDSDVVFGVWDRDSATFTATTSDPNAVRVTLARNAGRGNELTLFFARIFGQETAAAGASATASRDQNLCGPLVGIEWISVPGGPRTDSYRSDLGPYAAQPHRDNGSLCSDGPIGLTGNPVVNGDANPGRGHKTTLDGGAVVTGNKSPRLRPLNLPGVDTTEISASNTNGALPPIQKGNSMVSPMDANRNFLLDGGKTYTMPAGRYYFNDFTLTGQSKLYFTGPTTIYATGRLDTSGGNVFNSTQIPSNVTILMTGSTARVTASVDFYGVLYAPNTAVTVDGGGQFFGAAVGRTLTLSGTGDIHYDEDLDLEGEVDLPTRVALVQ